MSILSYYILGFFVVVFESLCEMTLCVKDYSLKGGDPAAPSDTATLLRLNPSHWFYLRQLPPISRLAHRLWVPPTPMA